MRRLKLVSILIALPSIAWSADIRAVVPAPLQLRSAGQVTQLFVRGQPMLLLGGELGNSTASDPAELDRAFDKLQQMHLNTVMLPVYWDRIEPVEGTFDFTLLQQAIDRARAHHLHLVLLWFGTWKNSMSCYVPSWMKRDSSRFTRARDSAGQAMEIISAQCDAACEADCRAFAAVMRQIKAIDADQQTVLMVQVENEIGMIPEPRDHSSEAERAYELAVPAELLAGLMRGDLGPDITALWQHAGQRTSGSWSEVFGSSAPSQELFTAWSFAKYTARVAAAGQREYRLPMYVNAALVRPAYLPGKYPSGGPLPHLMALWKRAAPSLNMLSPDIYFPNFIDWAQRYEQPGNPLFIPEMAPSARATANAVYAFAQLGAIGVGPFAIEDVDGDLQHQLTELYGLLDGIAPRLLTAQQHGMVIGLSPHIGFDWSSKSPIEHAALGGFDFRADFTSATVPTSTAAASPQTSLPTLGAGKWEAPPGTPLGAVMILQLGPEEFYLLGKAATVTFSSADGKGEVGLDTVEEGRFGTDGNWLGGRWLNGDQTHQGRHIRFDETDWSMQRVTLYRYR